MCNFFCRCKFSTHLGKYRGAQRLCLGLYEIVNLSSKVTIPFHIPTSNKWEYLLFHTLCISIGIINVLVFHYSNMCIVVSHCCYNLQFLIIYDTIFLYAYLLFVHLLWGGIFRYFAQFLIGLFSYCWVLKVLCTFWMQIFYQMFSKYFLPVCGLFLSFSKQYPSGTRSSKF